ADRGFCSRCFIYSQNSLLKVRPEITIVAAEPLRPSSWFPGASPVTPHGLGFPSASSHAQWRRNEHIPAELPPSYEQVIKEINQVQVNTTNNNNAAAPRHTTTSATQTDFPEELISHLPGTGQSPLKPPRPSASLLNRSLSENENPLIVFEISEGQRCQENPNAVICPVPKPRSRSNLRPVIKSTESKIDNGEVNQSTTKRQQPSIQQSPLLDDSLLDNHLVMDSMSTEKSQNSIVSRIKVFELQGTTDTSGLSKKPEIAPRSFAPRPVTAKKPVVAPKPGVSRISGDWDAWTESKSTPSKELQPQPEVVGSNVVTKPELPKKPKPGLVKSSSSDFLDAKSGSVAENNDGQKKFPVPAPRPLVPKKSRYVENPALSLAPLKPIAAPPRASVSPQEKVFKSLGELSPAANSSAPALQNKSVEGDLISFDDDVLTLNPAFSSEFVDYIFLTKSEPAKEQTAQPALARKPTVIRIPAKPGKSLNEIPHSPPPLPAEKPIGNTSDITVGKPNSERGSRLINMHISLMVCPIFRPADGKIIPARPPPPKGVPGRPPPPKLSAAKISSQKDALSRSTSDIAPDKKPSKFRLGPKRTKSQVFKSPDPALPPRPKPGHPLYNKYMLPVPHGVAKEDCLPRNTGELSSRLLLYQKGEETSKVPLSHRKIITPLAEYLKSGPKINKYVPHAVVLHDFPAEHADDLDLHSGDTVCLLEKIDTEWYRGKCGNHTGIFPASFVKVVVCRLCIHCYIRGPRCVARFEYIGDQKDELSFSEGETIILKEYVNEEWAKGELRGMSGIFPLNFVEVIEDLPGTGTGAALKNKVEVSSSAPQNNRCSVEWCEALHDFTAETKDDLSFKKGDYIQILEQVDLEWYRGRLNEKEGIFPAVFVQTCSVELSQSVGGKKGKAKALYDFHGENEDELSFKAGDTITEVEPVDKDWMSGEIQGKSGIFPKNFVQILKTP
uniref:SH3 domain containing 19 n=1 Tax=Strix occidentalis caurina TaxID=311401 RepID=A0A8D0G0V5_STROC